MSANTTMSNDTGGHWYSRDGKPCHTYKNKKGEEKKTGLAEARKQILFPSFSTVVKATLQNQQIVEYAKRCVAESAYDSRFSSKEKEEWMVMVLGKSDEDRDGAADLGTGIHNSIEVFLKGKEYAKEHEMYVECARSFISEREIQICSLEKTFANLNYGYGGTIDLVGKSHSRDVICDWKSRRTKPGEKVRHYETHPMQIASYFMGEFNCIPNEAVGFNVYLSTTEPGRMDVVEYDRETLLKEWNQFSLLLNYWQNRREFWPNHQIGMLEMEETNNEL